MNWSPYQNRIFNFVQNETGNAIIEAVAGSGKSTTIIECMNLVPKNKTAIFLAFNRSIAKELESRGVNARTFHSLCWKPAFAKRGEMRINDAKIKDLYDANVPNTLSYAYKSFCVKLVGLAKNIGVGCLVENTYETWFDIIEHNNLEVDTDDDPKLANDIAIKISQKLLRLSNESMELDYDDLLYFPILDNVPMYKFDYVFVDEAQDTNAIQREILKKIMKPSSRIIAVGDPHQAIYGFRGASHNSLDLIAEDFNCVSLPLTVSYRCPKAIVRHAHSWVSHIEAADTAEEGKVTHLGKNWEVDLFNKTDYVLCRVNKPLVSLAYKMLVRRIPCNILGKDFGKSMETLIKKMRKKDLRELQEKIENWANREVAKAKEANKDSIAEAIRDKADAVIFLIGELEYPEQNADDLIELIDNLFADKKNCVTLSSIHKAKGLEADNIFWLVTEKEKKWRDNTFGSLKEWQVQQERNLCYVATTRAKKTLTILAEKDEKQSEK